MGFFLPVPLFVSPVLRIVSRILNQRPAILPVHRHPPVDLPVRDLLNLVVSLNAFLDLSRHLGHLLYFRPLRFLCLKVRRVGGRDHLLFALAPMAGSAYPPFSNPSAATSPAISRLHLRGC